MAEGVSPNLFINHVVAAKENYYSIGRIYNISPKEIAPYNNLKMETGLNLEQVLKIPLNSSNFFQNGKAAADETFVPVYYAVKEKEGLYRVAVNHNNLPLETLKKWNNISDDAIQVGARLVVGYLKVKKELSYLAKTGIGNVINANAVAAVKTEERQITEPVKKITTAVETATNAVTKEKKETEQPVAADKEKVKPAEVNTVKQEKKEDLKEKKEEPPVKETKKATAGKAVEEGGVFKNTFEYQTINAEMNESEGTAGVFKSTSGWSDKKYYCLYNQASQGTILKITNPANQKFVYAKVLDLIPDLKQNNGVSLLISNAAADALGMVESSFECLIKYPK